MIDWKESVIQMEKRCQQDEVKVVKITVKFDIFAWCHLESLKMIVKMNSRFSPQKKKKL